MDPIIIIGGGPFGSSTALHLSTLAPSAPLLVIAPKGSTHHAHNDTSRLYRLTNPSPYAANLAALSLPRYPSATLHPVGWLGISSGDSPWRRSQVGVCPAPREGDTLLFSEDGSTAGYLDPTVLCAGNLERVVAAGGRVMDDTVVGITADGCVTTAKNGVVRGRVVVVCTGAFVNCVPVDDAPLCPTITLKTQSVVYFKIAPQHVSSLPNTTIVYGGPSKGEGEAELAEDSFYYVPVDSSGWCKMGHGKELELCIDGRDGAAIHAWYDGGGEKSDELCIDVITKQFSRHFSVPYEDLKYHRNGITTDTLDGKVDVSFKSGVVAVCAGCNGGGAKGCDEVGRECASMVLERLRSPATPGTALRPTSHQPTLPKHALAVLLLLLLLSPLNAAVLHLGFCSHSDPTNTYYGASQPATQLERYKTITYNATTSRLNLFWEPDESLCLTHPQTYAVNVHTNSWLLNKVINVFGGFPQDTCAASSKAGAAVLCDDGLPCSACTTAWDAACVVPKQSDFLISSAMINAAKYLKVSFQVEAYGRILEGTSERDVEYWCFHFRPGEEGVDAMTVIDSKATGHGSEGVGAREEAAREEAAREDVLEAAPAAASEAEIEIESFERWYFA